MCDKNFPGREYSRHEDLQLRRADESKSDFSVVDLNIPNVKAIRRKSGLTQQEFAVRYGFPVATLRNWEQERRRPEMAALLLLEIIRKEPDAVTRALRRLAQVTDMSSDLSSEALN